MRLVTKEAECLARLKQYRGRVTIIDVKDLSKAGPPLLKRFGFGGVVWDSDLGRNSGGSRFHRRLVQGGRRKKQAREMAKVGKQQIAKFVADWQARKMKKKLDAQARQEAKISKGQARKMAKTQRQASS